MKCASDYVLFTNGDCIARADFLETHINYRAPGFILSGGYFKLPMNISQDISKDEKIEKLKVIAQETVDIKGIGFYTLGAKRKSLSDEEKKRYSKLFEEYFLKSFSSRLVDYSDPKISIVSERKINEKFYFIKDNISGENSKSKIWWSS